MCVHGTVHAYIYLYQQIHLSFSETEKHLPMGKADIPFPSILENPGPLGEIKSKQISVSELFCHILNYFKIKTGLRRIY